MLNIVGIGPGDITHLSIKAYDVLLHSQVIVGYSTYIKLLGRLTKDKEIISSGMTREIDRANQAIEMASLGKIVSIISSGDSGIYGMAALVLELLNKNYGKKLKVNIIPGITAASSCAGLLGAPLSQDFAVISLSDLLVSSKEIKNKLKAALMADFVIVLYNPKSKTRTAPLDTAWSIIKRYRALETPVGVVKAAARPGEKARIITLKDAPLLNDIDMTTTIVVGNSRTFIKDGFMITPRGYNIRKVIPR